MTNKQLQSSGFIYEMRRSRATVLLQRALMACVVQLMLKSWLLIANQIRQFCYSYDFKKNAT